MHPQDWNLPYGLTILTLFCIGMVRSNGSYWIGWRPAPTEWEAPGCTVGAHPQSP